MSILELLDRFPKDQDEEGKRRWRGELERSLTTAPREWVSAAGPPGSDELATDRAWVLLSWVEDSASDVVRGRRRDLVETAAFAMSLLEASPLDRRDVIMVAMLVRRASTIAGLPFSTLVGLGCRRAGDLGAQCQEWLLRVPDATPPTHEETGNGRSFAFRRKPRALDAPQPQASTSGLGAYGPPPGDRKARATEVADGEVWPAPARYLFIAVFGAVALIGLITVLFDRGWLPLAGPFVATVVASTLVFLILYWRTRRVRRLSADAVHQLRDLASAIARERTLAPDARPTRASDQSLAQAAEQVERALGRFASGREQGASRFVDDLAATARESWLPAAPLSHDVRRLARTTARLDELLQKMLAAAERRRR